MKQKYSYTIGTTRFGAKEQYYYCIYKKCVQDDILVERSKKLYKEWNECVWDACYRCGDYEIDHQIESDANISFHLDNSFC